MCMPTFGGIHLYGPPKHIGLHAAEQFCVLLRTRLLSEPLLALRLEQAQDSHR